MATITIETRRAHPEDACEIAQVHADSWRHAYSGMVPHAALSRMINRRDADWWATAIRRATVILVVEMADEIAGYATIGPNRVSTLPFEGEIYELYLKPEFQGVGLGSKLFLDARTELRQRGYKGVAVWVLSDNEPAIQFYKNAGGRAVASGSEHFDNKKLCKTAFAWD